MLDQLFSQPALVQLLAFTVHGLAVFLIALWFMKLLHWRFPNLSEIVPVGPSFASVTSIFALLLAFHAAAIWSHRQSAERAFTLVQASVDRFDDLIGPAGLNAQEVQKALRAYVQSAVDEEWIALRNKRMGDKTEIALLNLELALLKFQLAQPEAARVQLNGLLDDIVRSRSERLWIGQHHTEPIVWFSVLLIGCLSHFAIAAIHADKPRAGAIMLALFAFTTTVAYWSLGLLSDPYRDLENLNPESLLDFRIERTELPPS